MSKYYRIYCETDDKWEYQWVDTGVTQCPSNPAHTVTIDGTSPQQLSFKDKVTKLRQESAPSGFQPTGSNFMAETVIMDIEPGVTYSYHTQTYPIPIGLIDVTIQSEEEHRGDEMLLEVPDTLIGVLSGNVDAGVTATTVGIDIPRQTINYIKVGYYLTITDGVNSDDLGRVLNINKNTLKVVVENEPVNSYLASSPTYIYMRIHMSDLKFGPPMLYALGTSTLGSTYYPANTPGKFTYTCNDVNHTGKKLYLLVQYFY